MAIGNVRAAESAAGGQMAAARAVDTVSKGIQNEISNAQRQMQKLSSNADMSVEEKVKKRQELQQQISNLNTRLRQHQAEMRREQQKDKAADETEAGTAVTEAKMPDAGISRTGMEAITAADASFEQVKRQGMVVARIEGGIGVLKAEIVQDEFRGVEVERKKEELAKLEEKAQKAAVSRSETIGEAHQAMRTAAQTERDEKQDRVIARGEKDSGDRVLIKSTNFSKDKNQGAQQMHASVDIRG